SLLSSSRFIPVLLHMSLTAPRPPLFPYTTLFRSRTIRTNAHQRARSSVASAKRRSLSKKPSFPISITCLNRKSAFARSISINNRSEEHTSELQSRENLVCRLPLEEENNNLGHQLS